MGRGLLFPFKFSADGAVKTEDAAGADAVAEATAAAAAAATAEATTVKVLCLARTASEVDATRATPPVATRAACIVRMSAEHATTLQQWPLEMRGHTVVRQQREKQGMWGVGAEASDSDALLVGAKQRLNQSRSASLDDCDRD